MHEYTEKWKKSRGYILKMCIFMQAAKNKRWSDRIISWKKTQRGPGPWPPESPWKHGPRKPGGKSGPWPPEDWKPGGCEAKTKGADAAKKKVQRCPDTGKPWGSMASWKPPESMAPWKHGGSLLKAWKQSGSPGPWKPGPGHRSHGSSAGSRADARTPDPWHLEAWKPGLRTPVPGPREAGLEARKKSRSRAESAGREARIPGSRAGSPDPRAEGG